MAIQISIFNLVTKDKDIRYIYDEENPFSTTAIMRAQMKLYDEIKNIASYNIVMTERV